MYEIRAVPEPSPVTMPVGPTAAVKGALLLQVPPATASLREVVKPIQAVAVPNIAVGVALTA